jgi:hypothetical protein
VVNKVGRFEFGEISDFLQAQKVSLRQAADIVSGLGAVDRVAAETLAIASHNSLASYLTAIADFQRRVDLAFVPVSSALSAGFELPQPFSEVARSCAELVSTSRRFEATVRDKAERLGWLGWTIPCDATLPATIRLLERSTSAETADAAFTEFYSLSEGAAYASLKRELLAQAELEPWQDELITACARLENDDYRSCVNNLLPVLDGFGATKLREPRFYSKRARDRFFARTLTRAGENSLLDDALWRSVKAFLDGLFEPLDFAVEVQLSKRLNRHARLHGRGPYRPTRADCLRLLQALHTFSLL